MGALHHRHPRLRHRQAPLGRRHAGRRRPRHGDARRYRRGGHRCRARARCRRTRPPSISRRAARPLTQARARELAQGPGAILLCGRFEGVDERVLEARNVEEVSIGDYVLSGGELAAMVLIDAVRAPAARASPATRAPSPRRASPAGLLEYPHYTRPREWEGRAIPEVLLSGDHEKIAKWRREQAEDVTKRPPPRSVGEIEEALTDSLLLRGRAGWRFEPRVCHAAARPVTRRRPGRHRPLRRGVPANPSTSAKARLGNLSRASAPAIIVRINQKEWRSPEGHTAKAGAHERYAT